MSQCGRWAEPFILVDGEVIPDCAILMQSSRDFLHEISFGNVFQMPFEEIWNSPRYRTFRKAVVLKNGVVPRACVYCSAFDTGKRARSCGIEP